MRAPPVQCDTQWCPAPCVGCAWRTRHCQLVQSVPRHKKRAVQPAGRTARASAASDVQGTGARSQPQMRRTFAEVRAAAEARMSALMGDIAQRLAASSGGAQSASADPTAELRGRLEAAIEVMQEGLVERDTEVRLLLLAALAGEHILYLGPPGTAKSELGRRLAQLYDGPFFERLLTRFSVPEELFGPLSMRALEDDRYVRQTDGYLPAASVAFIDEVFKANSAILNTLLTILNERLFDNGADRVRVPLVCLVGASNELPESEELDALYDRFLIRRRVAQVSAEGLPALLNGSAQALVLAAADPGDGADGAGSAIAGALSDEDFGGRQRRVSLTQQDFARVRRQAASAVAVPEEVVDLLADLREHLQDKCEPPVYVSDRRLVKAVALMQVAAYTSGRSVVSLYDCLLLQHVLWQRPDEAPRIADWLVARLAVGDNLKSLDYSFSGMFSRAMNSSADGTVRAAADLTADVGALAGVLAAELAAMGAPAAGGAALAGHELWLGREEAEALVAAIRPKQANVRKGLEELLFEAALGTEEPPELLLLTQLLPRRWSAYLRSAPVDDVRRLSTRKVPATSAPYATP
ncbi:hypothetical protein WJX81_001717 [Elliptochloris bilobata]|uniref:AAA+ ATPase domain-containing protein n=1 Tax=Elliptochloris bilobata TaxID=381761 RepID=A0AAW1S933_9CHLO